MSTPDNKAEEHAIIKVLLHALDCIEDVTESNLEENAIDVIAELRDEANSYLIGNDSFDFTEMRTKLLTHIRDLTLYLLEVD